MLDLSIVMSLLKWTHKVRLRLLKKGIIHMWRIILEIEYVLEREKLKFLILPELKLRLVKDIVCRDCVVIH